MSHFVGVCELRTVQTATFYWSRKLSSKFPSARAVPDPVERVIIMPSNARGQSDPFFLFFLFSSSILPPSAPRHTASFSRLSSRNGFYQLQAARAHRVRERYAQALGLFGSRKNRPSTKSPTVLLYCCYREDKFFFFFRKLQRHDIRSPKC